MKRIETDNQNLGGYSNLVVVLNNDANSRKLAKRVAELNRDGRYVMTYENTATISYIAGALYVCNSVYDIQTFCSDPDLEEIVKNKKNVIGSFSGVIDQNDCIITLELTVFHDLTIDDIKKHSANANI